MKILGETVGVLVKRVLALLSLPLPVLITHVAVTRLR